MSEITITDRVFHHKAKWLKQLAISLRELGINYPQKSIKLSTSKPQMTETDRAIPNSVLNALLHQGYSLLMRGNLANFKANPRIQKGNRQFTLVNEGEFWWVVPVEGEIAEGERIFPIP